MKPILITFLFLAQSLLTFSHEGTPWKRHTIDNSSRGADGVRLADVNHDGFMDIVTGWEEGGVIRITINPGLLKNKQPWPSVTVGQVGSPEDAVFVDLDSDGNMDVVSCSEGNTKQVWVHCAPKDSSRYMDSSAWKTESFPAVKSFTRWMFCLPLQIDNKHGTDLIVGSKNPNAVIGWLKSPPNPRVLSDWTFHLIFPASWIMSLEPRDMNHDGRLDIIATDRKGAYPRCFWLETPENNPENILSWKHHTILDEPDEYMFLDHADLNADGLLDVLSAIKGKTIRIAIGQSKTSDKWKTSIITLPENMGTGKAVRVGDINLDGQNDIVVSCENATEGRPGVLWFSYQESIYEQTWQSHEISGPAGIKFDLVELIDLDRDGDLDVLTCEERDNLGVIWYENPSRP